MPALTAVTRAGMAQALSAIDHRPLEKAARLRFGDDLDPITRAAVAPHSTGDAAAVGQQTLAQLLVEMGPASAAATILAGALRLGGRRESFRVPLVTANPTAAWVAELDPIPVSEMAFDDAELTTSKLAALTLVSRELLMASTAGDAIEELLRQAVAKTLDVTMFSTAAAAPPVPAGLLHGVAPITGFPGGDAVAALADVRALVAATVSGAPVLVARPERLVALRHLMPSLGLATAASEHVPADALIAVAPRAVATTLGEVDVTASTSATVHMSSTPLPIGDEGFADPVRSTFQTATTAIRITLDVGWARRSARAAAFVEGASW